MYKLVYDKIVEEYTKEEKGFLIEKLMVAEKIECKDRVFANECMTGICVIEELIDSLKENGAVDSYEFKELLARAEMNLGFIKSGLIQMKKDTRVSEFQRDHAEKLHAANDPYDSI